MNVKVWSKYLSGRFDLYFGIGFVHAFKPLELNQLYTQTAVVSSDGLMYDDAQEGWGLPWLGREINYNYKSFNSQI